MVHQATDEERRGRSVIYTQYDNNHVAELLEQALYYVEHLRFGLYNAPTTPAWPRPRPDHLHRRKRYL